jgi:pyruvate,water dikinase
MGLFSRLFGRSDAQHEAALQQVRAQFTRFRSLLDLQNRVLKTISDLETRSRRNLPIDGESLAEIEEGVGTLVERMIELGGPAYTVLRDRYEAIRRTISDDASRVMPVAEDAFVIPYDQLDRERTPSVGTKNANLGEMMSRLGLPVPDGFAISAWAYRRFMTANRLEERTRDLLRGLDAARLHDRESVSETIRALFLSSPVPDDLRRAIEEAFDALAARNPDLRFALRSSAIGEDTALTFAGQYLTLLNVRRAELLDGYKEVLAGQFAPSALFYYSKHHDLHDADTAMGVGCMALVDATASGVIYTRDPLNPDAPTLLVNAILGLGSHLVEGDVTPDVFILSRDDRTVQVSKPSRKTVRLVAHPGGGSAEEAVPEADQEQTSIDESHLRLLAGFALKLEEHFKGPQDIEWAVDREGRLHLLQTRPLRLMRRKPASPAPPELRDRRLAEGGTPLCSGAGGGPVFHVRSTSDLGFVPDGAVVVAPTPSPKLIAIMHKAAALVTRVGGTASHLATLAREADIPTVAGIERAESLPAGKTITVDASEGILYDGMQNGLIETRCRERVAPEAAGPPSPLQREVDRITRLTLIHPADPGFRADRCRTMHDVIRFIHQKAMEEMFSAARGTAHKDAIGQRLRTRIPLVVDVIHLEPGRPGGRSRRWIAENEIASVPMQALWQGILEEGWPSRPVAPDIKGFLAVMGTNISQGNQPEFSENSYAFLGREYMLLNLRMGYHYATVESLVTPEPSKNYIRMQYKEGGAPLDRRIRRIRLICDLLRRMGFENASRGDFLDATLAYQDAETTVRTLRLVGRINILTKQLDMALSNDSVTQWYTDDFVKKLGLERPANGHTPPGASPASESPSPTT